MKRRGLFLFVLDSEIKSFYLKINQLVLFIKNNCEGVCKCKILVYLCTMQNGNNTQKAVAKQIGNMAFLDFFNSKEVYSIKGFDTLRKAKNYAAKWGYTLFTELPKGVSEYQNNN